MAQVSSLDFAKMQPQTAERSSPARSDATRADAFTAHLDRSIARDEDAGRDREAKATARQRSKDDLHGADATERTTRKEVVASDADQNDDAGKVTQVAKEQSPPEKDKSSTATESDATAQPGESEGGCEAGQRQPSDMLALLLAPGIARRPDIEAPEGDVVVGQAVARAVSAAGTAASPTGKAHAARTSVPGAANLPGSETPDAEMVNSETAAPEADDKPKGAQDRLSVSVRHAPAAPKPLMDSSLLAATGMPNGDVLSADATLTPSTLNGDALPLSAAEATKDAPTAPRTADTAPKPAATAGEAGRPIELPTTPAAQPAHATATAAAQSLRALSQHVPAHEQVAVEIVRAVRDTIDHIRIQMDPADLGRVDVRLEVGHDGRVIAVMAAERQETVDMLQRDARSLERALQDAGLKTGNDSLNFNLRQQGNDAGTPHTAQRGANAAPAETSVPSDLPSPATAARAMAAALGKLDISV